MTDAEFELELVEALNMLLEDERASVEMEVALASGATEYAERDTLAAMGAEDIRFCVQLRDEMEDAGLPVTPQINGVVFEIIGAERYDDRLRAFAHHQRVVADRARELQESNLEGALRAALDGISMSHDLHADWIERRAAEFAATRTLEFGASARALETREAAPEPIEPIEPASADQPDLEAASLTATPAEVPVVEPEPATEPAREPAPEEPAAPQTKAPKPRARATSRSTTAGSAKPGATRAKTTKTTKATKTTTKKADAQPKTPTRRTRRAPDADTPPDEA